MISELTAIQQDALNEKDEAERIVTFLIKKEDHIPTAELTPLTDRLRTLSVLLHDSQYDAWAWKEEGESILWFGDINDAHEALVKAANAFEAGRDYRGLAYTSTLLGVEYRLRGNFAEAKNAQIKALECAQASGIERIECSACINLGSVCFELGDYAESMKYLSLALANRERAGDRRRGALIYSNIASLLVVQGKYPEALKNFFLSRDIREEFDDKEGLAEVNAGLGELYHRQGDNAKALKYYLLSLKYSDEAGALNGAAYSHLDIGRIYVAEGRYAEAKESFDTAQDMLQRQDDQKGVAVCYLEMGDLARAGEQYEKALEYYQQAQQFTRKAGFKSGEIKVQIGLAAVYSAQREYQKATTALLEANETAEQMNDLTLQKDCAIALSEAYTAMQDYERALYHHRQYHRISTALLDEQSRKQLNQLNMEQVEKNLEFEKSARKSEEEKNVLLSTQKELTEETLAEREVLLREIHHRVKNNLEVISSMLELQGMNTADETAKGALSEGQNRVYTIALIHQRLYQHENLAEIELKGLAADLYRQVATVFHSGRGKIEFANNIPETNFDIDTAVPLGLMINELFTNAFKYAFSTDKDGTLGVSLARETDDIWVLTAYDNGPGIPAGYDLRRSKSLGMRLLTVLSKQLHGSIGYRFNGGSIFEIRFQNTDSRKKTL